ncbi:MAG: hypothetical protein M9894_22615 [Planctomycetes bacterium]|nr:hypothetical protein [Planctomycetota bacterium]
MRLWRLVLDTGRDAWTLIVASTDPFVALELARDALPQGAGEKASLEELEALYDPPPSRAGVVQAWRGGVEVRRAASPKAAPRKARAKAAAGPRTSRRRSG